MRSNKIRFRLPTSAASCFSESIGERQIRQPDGTLGRPDEQVGVRREVGVETQRGAAHQDLYVVVVIGCGEFRGNQSAKPPQLGGRRAPSAYLAVQRVRH